VNKYRLDYYIKNGNALLIRGSELLDKMQKHAKETREVETYWYKADDVADLAKRSKTVIENLLDVLQNTAGLTMSTEFKREIDESIAELGRIAGK